MTGAFSSSAPSHCERCGRSLVSAAPDATKWNLVLASGYTTGAVCPNCQTAEESLGAEIDAVELADGTPVDWNALDDRTKADLRVRAIYQRAEAVVRKHRDRAEMAGNERLEVDVLGWAAEAIASWPGIVGQSERTKEMARGIAADRIREMLRPIED